MENERQRDTEALLCLIRGEIGLRKVHRDITLPRVVGYIHELGSYRRTNMKPDEINKMKSDRDYWEREAKKWCDKSFTTTAMKELLEKAAEEIENCYGKETDLTKNIRELI